MPYLDLSKSGVREGDIPSSALDGVTFAHAALEFAALAETAEKRRWLYPEAHLYALAIELALKSLALRAGASIASCRKAGHDPVKIIDLIENQGIPFPHRIKKRIGNKEWFHTLLFMSRYPAISEFTASPDNNILLPPESAEIVAELLEIKCKWPLTFKHGSALKDLKKLKKKK